MSRREPLPIYFLQHSNSHNWEKIEKEKKVDDDDEPESWIVGLRCKNCALLVLQDSGSLGCFVIDPNIANLTCEELQIKSVIE